MDANRTFTINHRGEPDVVSPGYMVTLLRSLANGIESGNVNAASITYGSTRGNTEVVWNVSTDTAPRADEREDG